MIDPGHDTLKFQCVVSFYFLQSVASLCIITLHYVIIKLINR